MLLRVSAGALAGKLELAELSHDNVSELMVSEASSLADLACFLLHMHTQDFKLIFRITYRA